MSLLLSAGGGTDATVNLIGVGMTSAVGTLLATGDATIALTGAAVTIAAGTVVATGSAGVVLTGVEAASAAGTLSAFGDAVFALTGQGLTIAAGTLGVIADASTTITGVVAASAAGNPSETGDANVAPSGLDILIAAGTVTASGPVDATVMLSGVDLVMSAGTLQAQQSDVALGGGAAGRYPYFDPRRAPKVAADRRRDGYAFILGCSMRAEAGRVSAAGNASVALPSAAMEMDLAMMTAKGVRNITDEDLITILAACC